MSKAVLATTSTATQTFYLLSAFHRAGIPSSDVSVILARRSTSRASVVDALVGGAAGRLGASFGAVVLADGPLFAAGPLFGMLSSAGTVEAVIGTLTGVLLALDFSAEQARRYQSCVARGRVVVSVHTENRRRQRLAADLYRRFFAADISYEEGDRPTLLS